MAITGGKDFPSFFLCACSSKMSESQPWEAVLVCLGCCNKIPYIDWWPKQQKFVFSHFWSLGSPRSRYQRGYFMVSHLSLGCRQLPSCHVLTWPHVAFLLCIRERERAREWERARFLLSVLVRTLTLLDQDPTLLTLFNFNYIHKDLSLNTFTLGVGASAYGFSQYQKPSSTCFLPHSPSPKKWQLLSAFSTPIPLLFFKISMSKGLSFNILFSTLLNAIDVISLLIPFHLNSEWLHF